MGGNFIVTGGSGDYKVTPEQLKQNVKDFVEKMKPTAALAAEMASRSASKIMSTISSIRRTRAGLPMTFATFQASASPWHLIISLKRQSYSLI